MAREIDDLNRDLARYRFLLSMNTDRKLREALLELIEETEARLRKAEAKRARLDRPDG